LKRQTATSSRPSTKPKRRPKKASAKKPVAPLFDNYKPIAGTYDELFQSSGSVRPGLSSVVKQLNALGEAEFRNRQRLADDAFLKGGVTFSVYADQRGAEKIFPFDLIPRVVQGKEWARVERGMVQRVAALNCFLRDIYGDQRILAEGVIPRAMVEASAGYIPKLRGVHPPHDVYVHVAGIDLIREPSGELVVLEDNARTPSGVSYVLENRSVMKRILPRIFANARVRSVDEYPTRLRDALEEMAPPSHRQGHVVVLTPGPFNSAYFEHTFLARRTGCHLVHPADLFVHDKHVFVKTTGGAQPVSVIYRRIDDDFLDPEFFRPESLLGVPGVMEAYAAGNVTLANAPGNGVADDKAIYPFVPDMIRFYLGEDAILGQVKTYVCERPAERQHVLENLGSMVVKAVDASGGYGMLVGPKASKRQIAEFADKIRALPRGYIAQPLIELSTAPTWIDGAVEPRRVDLRPYIVTGKSSWVLPGGLTRVALVKGSYVVNSSQGGGSKDTWVLEESRVSEES